jgi:pyrroline-5-carboxylate reductase
MAPRLQIIGGGKMGEALLGGLIDRGWAPVGDLHVVELDPTRRVALASQWPGLGVSDAPQPGVDTIVAVKPAGVADVAAELGRLGVRRVLSIAAGVPLGRIQDAIGADVAVVRAMPNTPALVGCGASAIALGEHAGTDDEDWARSILESVGTVDVVEERLLDAVTGLSGSGPGYVFLIAEALIDAGEQAGLPRALAVRLTEQTLLGASTLLSRSDAPASELRANVTSPNGTTAAGLAVFEAADLRGIVAAAVLAATERSRELGR